MRCLHVIVLQESCSTISPASCLNTATYIWGPSLHRPGIRPEHFWGLQFRRMDGVKMAHNEIFCEPWPSSVLPVPLWMGKMLFCGGLSFTPRWLWLNQQAGQEVSGPWANSGLLGQSLLPFSCPMGLKHLSPPCWVSPVILGRVTSGFENEDVVWCRIESR